MAERWYGPAVRVHFLYQRATLGWPLSVSPRGNLDIARIDPVH